MTAAPGGPPNILLVVADSLRADRVSCYGYRRTTTPNIDRLATEGCLFENAITAAPFSPASYASIFSNLYPHQHGVNGDTVRVWPDAWPRLPELMRQHGYFTFCITNNSFLTRATNGARGFDTFVDVREPSWIARQHGRVLRRIRPHFGDRVAKRLSSNRLHCAVKGNSVASVQKAISLIEKAKRPFFGFVILMDPHTPYNKLRTEYCGKSPAVRRFFRERNDRTMWAELMAFRSTLSCAELSVVRDLYDAETRHCDACIGTLLDGLRGRERVDNTVVAVLSDHGEAFGEHGVWGHGFSLNDCLTRVPLVLRHPRYWKGGTRFTGLVQLHDLHDLCCSLAADGIPRIDRHPHCLTQAADRDWPARPVVFSEFPRQTKTLQFMRMRNPAFEPRVWDCAMWAARSPHWRYIEYENGQSELYDLRADPGETASIAAANPRTCAEMHERLLAHKNDRPYSWGPAEVSEELDDTVSERLRALGYIE